MKKRGKGQDEEYNFWQPAADMMTALVFILILLVALLGLYLLNDYTDYHKKEDIISREYWSDRGTDDDWHRDRDNNSGGGGGEETTEPTTETEETTTQSPGGGGGWYGYGFDEGIKSAVLAEIVDEETGKIIPIEGVTFELYETNRSLQILNTYYPNKISYRDFSTTDKGNFYLPEKIFQGEYYFHETTEPEGYDSAEDQYFGIHEFYDWSDPYLVKIPLSPSRNIICVQMSDQETGDSVTGSRFVITAKEDVQTLDGTIRYRKGETVGEIVCDENGYGESEELYLGTYSLHEEQIPEYYAGMAEDLEAVTEKKTGEKPEAHEIEAEKTKIHINLVDERYPQVTLEGAEFQIMKNSDLSSAQTVQTDSLGNIILTDLDKNTTYHIRQTTAPDDYRIDQTDHELTVDAEGRIDGAVQADLALTNRMLRVMVQAVDAVFRRGSAGVKLDLYDSQDQLIDSWSEDGNGRMFTELSEGTYYVKREGDSSKRYEFTVKDEGNVQNWRISVLTWQSVAVLGGALIVFVGVLTGVYLVVRKLFSRSGKNFKNKKEKLSKTSSGEKK